MSTVDYTRYTRIIHCRPCCNVYIDQINSFFLDYFSLMTLRSIWERFQRPTRWECRRCVCALDCLRGCQWWSLRAVAVHLQVCILIRKQSSKRWKLKNISQGSAAALCRWGGQINNFCVAYFLCVKYCRNRSTYVDTTVNWTGNCFFWTHAVYLSLSSTNLKRWIEMMKFEHYNYIWTFCSAWNLFLYLPKP